MNTPTQTRPDRSLARAALAAIVVAVVAGLTACASGKTDPTAKWSVDHLYKDAHEEFIAGNWTRARELLEKLESRYPFGRYAQQAQIEIAYTYYKESNTEEALSTTDRFLKENPGHPNADYVYYLRGLANFNEPPIIIGKLLGYTIADRDPKALRDSFDAFKELVTRFPNSRYAPDAIDRMNYLVEALARHEVNVAQYYFERSAYLAAILRAQGVLHDYPQAPSTLEALKLMVRCYQILGMHELEDDAQRVIDKSFPQQKPGT